MTESISTILNRIMRKKIIHIIGAFLLFSSYSVNAETIKTQKWETIDIPFIVKVDIPNPFEVELTCTFTNENSDILIVPGFYNGNRQWMVRFTPNGTGIWKCTSQSSIKRMDGIVKTIEAPHKIFTQTGTQRVLYIHEDTEWCCVYKTDAETFEEAEADVYTDDYKNLPQETIKKIQLLWQESF